MQRKYNGISVVFYAEISEEEAEKLFNVPPQHRHNTSFLKELLEEVDGVTQVRIAKRTVTTVGR